MELEQGYFLISRKMFESWRWRDDPLMVALWIYLICKANYTDQKWHDIKVKRGQLITTISTLSNDTGLSVQQVRTRLQILEVNKQICSKSTNKYRMITICKYDDYQLAPDFNNKQITNKQQTNNKRIYKNKRNKYIYHSQEAQAHVCEESVSGDIERDFLEELKGNQIWTERICMNHHLRPTELNSMLDRFHNRCQEEMKTHTDVTDYCQHFVRCINELSTNGTSKQTKASGRRSYEINTETAQEYQETI